MVLDPTLQVTRDFWLNRFNITVDKEKSPYVLVYQATPTRDLISMLRNLPNARG